jgi:hypothetical protein
MRPRLRRIALWCIFLVGVPYALSGVPGVIAGWPTSKQSRHYVFPHRMTILLEPWRGRFTEPGGASGDPWMNFAARFPVFVAVGLAISLVLPLVLAFLPTTRARARGSARHLMRASVYQFAWFVPVMLACSPARSSCRSGTRTGSS